MRTAQEQQAIAETYEDVRLLIFDTCHRFHRQYCRHRPAWTIDELVGEANIAFMKAYDGGWNAEGGASFGTWVVRSVWNRLLSKVCRPDKRRRKVEACNPAKLAWFATQRREVEFDLSELSTGAAEIVGLINEMPDDLYEIHQTQGGKKQNIKKAVLTYLLGRGWKQVEVKAAFHEIKAAVSSV